MEGVQKTEVKSAVLNPSAEGGEEFTLTSDFVMFCSLLHFHPPNFFSLCLRPLQELRQSFLTRSHWSRLCHTQFRRHSSTSEASIKHSWSRKNPQKRIRFTPKFNSTSTGNILADSIDNSISEDSLASLIQMPGGCVEQNLARMTLPLIATLYLDRTNNWESVGVERRAEALSYITKGETRKKMNGIYQ